MQKLVLCFAAAVVALMLLVPIGASAATFYLRPDGTTGSAKPWTIVGASSAWDALNDEVTELETPSTTDFIEETRSGRETSVSLSSTNIFGVSIAKAQVWYYTGNSQPVEVRSTLDTSWQTSTSAGWHSINETIGGQTALDGIGIKIRTNGSITTTTPRQVRAAFLKIETTGPFVYWGAWMDGDVYEETNPGLTDAPWDQTTWNLFEAHAEKPVSVVHFGQPAPWIQKFSSEPFEKARNRGALPLMDMGTGGISLQEINEGAVDSSLEEWAEAVAAYEYPFFFRWAWEMNGTWFKWGEDAAASPEEFVKAWQRIHNIAAEKGATNVTWVWCPNVEFLGSTPYGQLYPGDEFVDWTCLDGYNRGGNTFLAVFQNSYKSLAESVAPSKPIMIGETATEDGGGGHLSKDTWIQEAIRNLPTAFPKIKAFLWFNWNIVQEGKEWEWPIEFGGGQTAFASEIKSPYFAANEFGSPAPLKPIQPLP
jgi:mannan endo-1,4-beta-mannosidase